MLPTSNSLSTSSALKDPSGDDQQLNPALPTVVVYLVKSGLSDKDTLQLMLSSGVFVALGGLNMRPAHRAVLKSPVLHFLQLETA